MKSEIGQWINVDEFGRHENDEPEDPVFQLGERIPSPEVGRNWDNLGRWKEDARWAWKVEEHNNVLEARAGLVSAKLATMEQEHWGKRHLLISDSQVTIGVYGKGRSSAKNLNLLARRLAALVISTGSRFYWRYIRTHRNHSDGPSRGEPLGVVQKESVAIAADLQLPQVFYERTYG